jgi:hypothetical protein
MNALKGLFKENGVELGNPWQHKIQYKKNYLALDTLFKGDSWFEASYHFSITPSLSPSAMKSITAVVERPDLWKVLINGKEVSKLKNSFWIEKKFPRYAVGEHLKSGVNTLTLKAPRMNVLAELMPVYLLGDFLVKPTAVGFEITGGNISRLGSWREAGLPFYSQKVAYTQKFRLANVDGAAFKVKLHRWNGTVAEVVVNGHEAGMIAFPPYELDITGLLQGGDNEITVNVTGSLKNTFGSFYKKSDDSWIFGPWDWDDAPPRTPAPSAYFLIDYGLMEPFALIMIKSRTAPST